MEKTGLVFGGGGVKGSYEIGVWMALHDLEIEPEIQGVSGTSIGALNTALFAQGNLQNAVSLWTSLTEADIVHRDHTKILSAFTAALIAYMHPEKISKLASYFKPEILFKSGILSQDCILNLIEQYINPLNLLTSPLELFACCCNASKLKPEYFSLKTLDGSYKSILLASAAIPGIFNAVSLNGHHYYDGGMRDNVPIQPLYDKGYGRMIVVNLDMDKKLKLSRFPRTGFYIITPQQQELFNVSPRKLLAFDPNTSFSRICCGYRDAVKVLADFPAQYRSNLYEQRSAFLPAETGQAIYLKNGLNLIVHKASIQTADNRRHVFLNVSTQMSKNSPLGDSCMMMANVLLLAFPDGTRSYVNLNISGEQMYDFPLQLTKGQCVNGYMAFPVPEHIQRFSLIIMDICNNASAGASYFLDFSADS